MTYSYLPKFIRIRGDCRVASAIAAAGIALAEATAIFIPSPAAAFAGIPNSGACTDFINNPQDFFRHRLTGVTYRIANNYKTHYPDNFSQYLVNDVVKLFEFYIGGVSPWNADIADRFSYYRRDPSEVVYELKSVLAHEFGHAIGMQHSDACFYNINDDTGEPYNANFRTSGGTFSIEPTMSEEMMNESPSDLIVLGKYNGPVDGYFRTPGRDVLEFAGAAYPFQSINFQKTNSNAQVILFTSTDFKPSGGQTSFPGNETDVVPGSPSQGQFINNANIWVGNAIGLKKRTQSWSIENFTNIDINQITLRISGTSTVRAISESAPAFFTFFGAARQSSPEDVFYSWTTPLDGPWPSTSTGWLSIELDVHDWLLSEALMWQNSNVAIPLFLSYSVAETPWAFATPNTLPPDLAPKYAINAKLPQEQTPTPDNIELIPPATDIEPSVVRGFTTFVPDHEDATIENFELLPIDWARAELLVRMPTAQRNRELVRLFETKHATIKNLLGGRKSTERRMTPRDAGFMPDERHAMVQSTDDQYTKMQRGNSERDVKTLSQWIKVDLPKSKTYAIRLVAKNEHARITSITMPEDTTYLGTELRRCDLASTAEYCCPTEMKERIVLKSNGKSRDWATSTAHMKFPSCIAGGAEPNIVNVNGRTPHFLTLGDGDDSVHVFHPGSVVLLGAGNDTFKASRAAASTVRGGEGHDKIYTSQADDHVESGEDDDIVRTFDGNDVIWLGAGNDRADAGAGSDTIYPGSGKNIVNAGDGDDYVVYLNACELRDGAFIDGGKGADTLILPVSAEEARRLGIQYRGFENIVEDASRASLFADCELE